MEMIGVILILVLIALIVSMRHRLSEQVNDLRSDLDNINDAIQELKKRTGTVSQPDQTRIASPATPEVRPVETFPPKVLPTITVDDRQTGFNPVIEPTDKSIVDKTPVPIAEASPVVQSAGQEAEPKPGFFERNPDLEKFIGENLVSKIGIVILVIAIGFFVKYAIDQNWIGPAARVGIGILCGGILIALAHKLRNNYRAFSSVLTGGGLAVFYFTITLAFQQFQLLPQTAAFICMLIITAFSVALSLLYDKQEVAVIALIGGFATPFMVSNGSGNYQALFTYLLVLNSGLLVLSYFKKWRLLNLLAFLFTVVLFGSWLFTLEKIVVPNTYRNALWFATAFYLLFFAINVAHNIRQQKEFIASDFGILLSNTALYFAVALYCLDKENLNDYRGILCIALAVFNLFASYLFFKNKKVDGNILYLLVGITLTFISLTAPIQLKGNNITLFWACETVLLYWLFLRSNIELMRITSILLWGCMLLSLFMDWDAIYFSYNHSVTSTTPLLNKGFITTLFAAGSSACLFVLRKQDHNQLPGRFPGIIPPSSIFGFAAISLLYIAGALEINSQFVTTDKVRLYQTLYTYSFVLTFLGMLHLRKTTSTKPWLKPLLLAISILIYLVDTGFIFDIQQKFWFDNTLRSHFIVHWIGAVLLAILLYQLIVYVKQHIGRLQHFYPGIVWIICAITVYYLSIELHLLVNTFQVKNAGNWRHVHVQYVKIGLPILWGICSFTFMWLGMHFKHRMLRIISLFLFGVTLIKLFTFDIRNISEGGKIAAFFCLGIILLVVSFMYQRLKKIIIEEKPGQ